MVSKSVLALFSAGLLGYVRAYQDLAGLPETCLQETDCITYVTTILVPISTIVFPVSTWDTEQSTEVLSSVTLGTVTTGVPSSEDVLVSTSTQTEVFSGTSATTTDVPVPPIQSSKISSIASDTSAESTTTSSFPVSNSFPTTSDLSTELSIIPTLISSLVTTSQEISTLVEQTTSVNPEETSSHAVSSTFVTADPVTDSGTTTKSLSISLGTGTGTTTTSGTITASSDISTSKVQSTAETTSDIRTTTTEALTTSNIETTTTTTDEATTTLPSGACGSVLSSPTLIFSPANAVDDSSAEVSLPFAISGFGASGSNIWVSTNGFITVNSATGSSAFANQPLPYDGVAPFSVFPYWDDLAVVGDGQDRIEYEVTGNDGERTVTINWCVKTLAQLDAKSNQFTATFYENDPGIALFRYYKTVQEGSSATVGGQNNDANAFVQYDYNQADSVPDMSFVRLDMNGVGSFTTGTF